MWNVRFTNEHQDVNAIYNGYPTMFSLQIHHGGEFSKFPGRAKCDVLLNNMCESLNNQLVKGRDKPIITSLEFIREYLMKRIAIVQKDIQKCKGPLTPYGTRVMEDNKKEACKYIVAFNGGQKYQVTGYMREQFVVDMRERSCTCRKWELTGMPCKHAIATIWDMGKNNLGDGRPENYTDPVYWLDTWKQMYEFKIDPINGRSMWPKSQCPTFLIPPHHHKQIGRPKKKRKKGVNEGVIFMDGEDMVKFGKLSRQGKSVKCSKCNNNGHNSRTCKGQSAVGGSKKVNKTFTMKKCGGGKNAANVDKSGGGKKSTGA
ncbi:hypothetical protein LXL04_032386 [Taraxacum kok-saghyz]